MEGSPLLFAEWAQGVLYLKDGSKADKFLFNIDLYSNEILFQHDLEEILGKRPFEATKNQEDELTAASNQLPETETKIA